MFLQCSFKHSSFYCASKPKSTGESPWLSDSRQCVPIHRHQFWSPRSLPEFLKVGQIVYRLVFYACLQIRSETIATYALCGFANFGSLGIVIGGLSKWKENPSTPDATFASPSCSVMLCQGERLPNSSQVLQGLFDPCSGMCFSYTLKTSRQIWTSIRFSQANDNIIDL